MDNEPGIRTYTVTFELRAVIGDTMNRRVFVNTVVALNEGTAHMLGERIGRTTAGSLAYTGHDWTFDPGSISVTELDPDNLGGVGPLLAAIQEEMLNGQEMQRVLAAAVTRYGPIELTADELDNAIPGSVTAVANGDRVWWILPHHLGVPFAVAKLPAIPANGMVDGVDLHQHAGREVLVSSVADPSKHVSASKWQWRTVLAVQDHPEGNQWRLLLTEHGAQTVITAGAYSVRNPRPVPVAVAGELQPERRDG